MSFTSWAFIIFVAISVLIYYVTPQRFRWTVLLIASIVFYSHSSPIGIVIYIGTSLAVFILALYIQKYKDALELWLSKNKENVDNEVKKAKISNYLKKQKRLVAVGVVICIGQLILYKYLRQVAENIVSVSKICFLFVDEMGKMIIPLGLSYYSLQLISYIVDVHRGVIKAEKNPFKVMLFGLFFLTISQGPFTRYDDIIPQIERGGSENRITSKKIKFACIRIVAGYIKKMCIADQVSLIVQEVFSNYTDYSGLGILFGVVCFAVQLYADFSGYMDIICGIGELFGLVIPENFKQPFFSGSISEFWQRWHITLGLWLKEYFFYPVLKSSLWRKLGRYITNKYGKKVGRAIPTYLGMLFLWLLIGIWHGAGFTYVFGVGILQFIYIVVGEMFKPVFDKAKKNWKINDTNIFYKICGSLKCLVLMLLAWIFFRSATFMDAVLYTKHIFTKEYFSLWTLVKPFFNPNNDILFIENQGIYWVLYVTACIAVLLGQDFLHEKNFKIRDTIEKQFFPIRLFIYLSMLFAIIIFGAYGKNYLSTNFIYLDF